MPQCLRELSHTTSASCHADSLRDGVSDRVMRVIDRFAGAYRRLTKAVPSALLTAVAKRTGEITQSRIGVAVGGYVPGPLLRISTFKKLW